MKSKHMGTIGILSFLVTYSFCALGNKHFVSSSNYPESTMGIVIFEAKVNGNNLEESDEIGIFDNGMCVGSIILNHELGDINNIRNGQVITAFKDDPGTSGIDGFLEGNQISFRFWDASEQEEIHVTHSDFYNQKLKIVELVFGSNDVISNAVSLIAEHNYHPKSVLPDQISTLPEKLVEIDGSNSYDIDQEPLDYEWIDVDGIGFSNENSSKITITTPKIEVEEKRYKIALKVTDPSLQFSIDTVHLIVKNSNAPPVLQISNQMVVEERSTINLDASESFDDDDDALFFTWYSDYFRIENSSSNTLEWIVPDVQKDTVIQCEVMVSDGILTSEKQTISITIKDINHLPSWKEVPTAQKVNVGNRYFLSLTATDIDTYDELTILPKSIPDWLNFTDTGNGSASLFCEKVPDQVGEHVLEFQLSDGKVNLTETCKLIVLAAPDNNVAPFLKLAFPSIVQEGKMITLDASDSSDENGDYLTYCWQSDVFSNENNVGPTFQLLAPLVQQDSIISVSVKAFDGKVESQLMVISIKVVNKNQIPLWETKPISETLKAGSAYEQIIKVIDPDGQASINIKAEGLPDWLNFIDEGNGVAKLNTLTVIPDVLTSVEHEIKLIAEDGESTIFYTFTLEVVPNIAPNKKPVIIVSKPTSVLENTTIVLDASSSYDPEGEELIYIWSSDNYDLGHVVNGKLQFITPKVDADSVMTIFVQASDGLVLSEIYTITLQITNVNTSPSWLVLPTNHQGLKGNEFRCEFQAVDIDGTEDLIIGVDNLPQWLSFEDLGGGKGCLFCTQIPFDNSILEEYQLTCWATDGIDKIESSITLTINEITSVQNQWTEPAILIYPNPATESVKIKLSETQNQRTISLLSVNGVVLFNQLTTQSLFVIPVDNYPKGLYYILIKEGKKQILKQIMVR